MKIKIPTTETNNCSDRLPMIQFLANRKTNKTEDRNPGERNG